METVMVLNGESRASLPFVRSLGKRDINVIVGANRWTARSLYSKYCKKSFIYPHSGDLELLHASILSSVKKLKPDVTIPICSDTFSVIIKHKKDYEEYTKIIPMVDYEKFQLLNNKASMTRLAKKFGVPVPETYFPETLSDLKKVKDCLPYPVLLKPPVSCNSIGILPVFNSNELMPAYKKLSSRKSCAPWFIFNKPIIQKFRPSNTFSAYALMKCGKVYAFMMKQNLIHYPFPFGQPIRSITVKDRDMECLVFGFLKNIRWEGFACLNFIRDPDDGKLKLIDFNPRVWGQMDASVAGGVDFPYIAYRLALSKKVDPVLDYKEGMLFSHVAFGELFNILSSKHKQEAMMGFIKLKNYKTNIDFTDIKPTAIQFIELIKDFRYKGL